MLTEAELRWVEETRHLCKRCEWNLWDNPCIRYGRLGMEGSCPGFSPRNLEHDFRDAAEFEARVAAKLADDDWRMGWLYDDEGGMYQRDMLKLARLDAEEDMERENEQ